MLDLEFYAPVAFSSSVTARFGKVLGQPIHDEGVGSNPRFEEKIAERHGPATKECQKLRAETLATRGFLVWRLSAIWLPR